MSLDNIPSSQTALKPKQSNWFRILISLLISIIFLYISFKGINLASFIDSMKKVSWWLFALSLVPTFLAYWFRLFRWRIMLKPIGQFKKTSLAGPLMIGFMGNNILPARIGEFLRAYALSKKASISGVGALATIVLERIFDGIILVAMLIWSILHYPFPNYIKNGTWIMLGSYMLLLIFLYFLQRYPHKTAEKTLKLFFFLPETFRIKVQHIIEKFIQGFSILEDWREIVLILVYSILVWFASALIHNSLLFACGMTDIPFLASIVILSITAVGVMIPAAPGYIGTAQYFTILALQPFGVDKTQALAYAIVSFISQYVPVTIIGIIYFYREKMSFFSTDSKQTLSKAS